VSQAVDLASPPCRHSDRPSRRPALDVRRPLAECAESISALQRIERRHRVPR
jgi:hypothetical protein